MARPRGRPRDSGADERILTATLEILSAVGYQGLSVDDVAARAGVAKTTLYRRWPTKDELVITCLQELATRRSPAPTGDWREDIRRSIAGLIAEANTPEGKAWNSVLAAAHNNPGLHVYFRRDDEPVVRIYEGLREGVARGELRADLDVELTMDLLVGGVVFRIFLLREDVDAALAASIVDIVLDGAGAATASPSQRLRSRRGRQVG
jgi:AcrR family transcriptional regulator